MFRSFKTILILSLIISCNDNQFHVDRGEINKGIVYEVNVRQYSKEGTFKAVTNDIKKIKELGVKILWLMPIHPIGKEKRKGGLGSYYSISDYKGINP
jgi:pullulanase/glycogen debranching enzyme